MKAEKQPDTTTSPAKAKSDRIEFYNDPRLYDIIHTPGTAAEVDGLARIDRLFWRGQTRRAGNSNSRKWLVGRRWFEPACGSGRYLRVAARRGASAVGIDLSDAMVAYANERANAIGIADRCKCVVADMTAFDESTLGGRVDFAFNTINTFRHLMSDRDALAHLSCVAATLSTGGVYAVGISLAHYSAEFASEDVWSATRGSTKITQVVQYEPATGESGEQGRREKVFSQFTVSTPTRGDRLLESSYELRTYDPVQWVRLIERSDFILEALTDERGEDVGGVAPGYAMCILRPRRDV